MHVHGTYFSLFSIQVSSREKAVHVVHGSEGLCILRTLLELVRAGVDVLPVRLRADLSRYELVAEYHRAECLEVGRDPVRRLVLVAAPLY